LKTIRRFLTNRSAATAIEYALIAAGISVAIIAGVNSVGTSTQDKFAIVSSALK
jgi:pilus assembly protein Flp/PilA